MLSCKDVSEVVSCHNEIKLSLAKRLGIRLHLMMCSMCRRYQKQINFIHRATQILQKDQTQGLPEDAKERIEQAVDKAQRKLDS